MGNVKLCTGSGPLSQTAASHCLSSHSPPRPADSLSAPEKAARHLTVLPPSLHCKHGQDQRWESRSHAFALALASWH